MSARKQYFINPETGRFAEVGGTTYGRLVKSKAYSEKELLKHVIPGKTRTGIMKDVPIREQRISEMSKMRVYEPPNLSTEAKLYRHLQPRVRQRLMEQIRAEERTGRLKPLKTSKKTDSTRKSKGVGRGGKTRGWKAAEPKRGKERHSMMKKCGQMCFLGPPGTETFPICPKGSRGEGICQIDQRGLLAAKMKARRHGYTNIALAAEKVEKSLGEKKVAAKSKKKVAKKKERKKPTKISMKKTARKTKDVKKKGIKRTKKT